MKKRNLILIALAITTLLVFSQIGAMAGILGAVCVIVPNEPVQNPNCPHSASGVPVCHVNKDTCATYWECCNYFESWCMVGIRDNTDCGGGCPCCY